MASNKKIAAIFCGFIKGGYKLKII
jgi:hypothetical protein